MTPNDPVVFKISSSTTEVSLRIKRNLEIQLSMSRIFSFPPMALRIAFPNSLASTCSTSSLLSSMSRPGVLSSSFR